MSVELKVPEVGESIKEVEIGGWLKAEGELVNQDEPLVAVESEKATIEVPAPVGGILSKILKKQGATAAVGEVIALLEPGGSPTAAAKTAVPASAPAAPAKEPAAPAAKPFAMPAAERLMAQQGVAAESVQATGPGGRILKEDVLRQLSSPAPGAAAPAVASAGPREEEVVPMTKLRRTVAQRLVEAQQTMAILTTFNEIDMSAVMDLRKSHQEQFQKKYGLKLGFMSFFVKAVIDALKEVPQLNGFIRGNDIVYHNFYDIGVAIGSGRGLVVPILRNAEQLSFAEVEQAIADYSKKAQENKLKPEELQGGTFTISNGGVYGSLLSTPIINPPQSGILGMHSIQERPVAVAGQVVIRPMMYVALSYDHRLVDGREAVTFLRRVKEVIEQPARMLLEV